MSRGARSAQPAAAAVPPVDAIPRVPTDAHNELVFRTPWEAKAFALVVHLYQQGHFTWPEWAARLGEEIAAAGTADDGSGYYLLWLRTAEKLVAEKALVRETEISARKQDLEAAQGGPAPAT